MAHIFALIALSYKIHFRLASCRTYDFMGSHVHRPTLLRGAEVPVSCEWDLTPLGLGNWRLGLEMRELALHSDMYEGFVTVRTGDSPLQSSYKVFRSSS